MTNTITTGPRYAVEQVTAQHGSRCTYLRPVIVRVVDTLEPPHSPTRIVREWGAHAYQLDRGGRLLDSRSVEYRDAIASAQCLAADMSVAWEPALAEQEG